MAAEPVGIFSARLLGFMGWDPLNPQEAENFVETDEAMTNLFPLVIFCYCKRFRYRVLSLMILIVCFICFSFLIHEIEGKDTTSFWFVFLSHAFLAVGPILFLVCLLCCKQGIWRFLGVQVINDNDVVRGFSESFFNDARTLLHGGASFSTIFIGLKLAISLIGGFSVGRFFLFLWGSYLVVLYVMTSGLILLGVRNLSIMVHLLKVMLQQGVSRDVCELLDCLTHLNKAIQKFSRRSSVFYLSQSVIVMISISFMIVSFTRLWPLSVSDFGRGCGEFLCLFILQYSVYWRSIWLMKEFNEEAIGLEEIAREAYIAARAREEYETVACQELRFIAEAIENRVERICICGRVVDNSMTDVLFPIQLAVGFFVGGPLISNVASPPAPPPTSPSAPSPR